MPRKSKVITREEFRAQVRAQLPAINEASKVLVSLADLAGKSEDFNFSMLQNACDMLKTIDEAKKNIKIVRDLLVMREASKTQEILRGE